MLIGLRRLRVRQARRVDYTTLFWISKKGSLLKRDDGTVVKIPLGTAKRIRARLPLG